jgi:hypothetical protein
MNGPDPGKTERFLHKNTDQLLSSTDGAAEKALPGKTRKKKMNPEKELPENTENVQEETKELGTEALENVAAAGNPFQDVPRVPLKPIDDKLRKNG